MNPFDYAQGRLDFRMAVGEFGLVEGFSRGI